MIKRLVSVRTRCSKLMNVKFQGDSSKPSRELNGLLAKKLGDISPLKDLPGPFYSLDQEFMNDTN